MSLSRPTRQRLERLVRGRPLAGDEHLRLLEGPKAIRDAVLGGAAVEVWVSDDLPARLREGLEEAARPGTPVHEAAASELARLGRTKTPQGALALVRDPVRPLAEVVRCAGPLLLLDTVQDPGNVGAIVRVAAGFGVGGVLACGGTADPVGFKALRASAGLALRLPFARTSADEATAEIAAAGRPLWLLDAGGETVFDAAPAPSDLVLALGSEGRGAGPAVRGAADRLVGIPLAAGVDSLNVAVAAGVAVAVLLGGGSRS